MTLLGCTYETDREEMENVKRIAKKPEYRFRYF